jgi:hypothetical protein
MSIQSKCYKCGGVKSGAVEFPMRQVYYDHTPEECFLVAIQRVEELEKTVTSLAALIEKMSEQISFMSEDLLK